MPTIAEADRANVVTDPVVIAEASTSNSQQKSTDRGNDTKNASDIIPGKKGIFERVVCGLRFVSQLQFQIAGPF